MKSVESFLFEWSNKLPEWEQFLLCKIVSQEEVSDEVIDYAYKLLKKEQNLLDDQIDSITFSFPCITSENQGDICKTILTKISDVKNINALVEGQCIEVNPRLTVIYGGKGSGKSGYTRILHDAGFTRGDHTGLRNVLVSSSDENQSVQSVNFTINVGGVEKTITHIIGQPCPELRKFYVFDSTSVKVHLNDQNEFSFSPMGMEYFIELAQSTDKVRALLLKEIEARSGKPSISQYLSGISEESKFLDGLTEKTTLEELERFCEITKDQERTLDQIPIELANLSNENISNHINELKSLIDTITQLIEKKRIIHELVSDENVAKINQSIENFNRFNSKITEIAEINTNYQNASTRSKWREFVQASFILSREIQDHNYPEVGDKCLLCQRELDTGSVNAIKEMWVYLSCLENVAYDEARKNIQSQLELVSSAPIPSDSIDYPLLKNYLSLKDPNILQSIDQYFSSLQQRKIEIVNCLREKKTIDHVIPIHNCDDELNSLLSSVRLELQEVELTIPETRINELKLLQNSLQDRKTLNKHSDQLKKYLANLKWIAHASKVGGNTKHITDAQNQVFKQLVTDEYLTIFNETLKKLERSLQVNVSTSGKKGKTVKQIVIKQEDSDNKCKPDSVLSEGEKRMVALIDFLTEVQLDKDSNGIVFDDPVTSLDKEWKELIAQLILEQSTQKQVIVFTHDLHFLYLIKEFAKELEVPHCFHWIKRSDIDYSPGHVFLNDSPASERDYVTGELAETHYKNSLTLGGIAQYNELCLGFGAIRSSYEALVIYELFGEVVQRFNEQVKIGCLKKISWDDEIAANIERNYGRISRYIDAHLHSDSASTANISPKKLKDEIDEYRKIRSEIKELKKTK